MVIRPQEKPTVKLQLSKEFQKESVFCESGGRHPNLCPLPSQLNTIHNIPVPKPYHGSYAQGEGSPARIHLLTNEIKMGVGNARAPTTHFQETETLIKSTFGMKHHCIRAKRKLSPSFSGFALPLGVPALLPSEATSPLPHGPGELPCLCRTCFRE